MDSDNRETLFSEVELVQNELNKYGAKHSVNPNQIYEVLEKYSYRNDRVQYAASRFLNNLGFKMKDVYEKDAGNNGSSGVSTAPATSAMQEGLGILGAPFVWALNLLKPQVKTEDAIWQVFKDELLECGCCFNDVRAEDMATCNEAHIFCKECIRKGAEVQIGNGKNTFPCLSTCDSEFSLKTLESVLQPSVFSKMLQRKQLEEVQAAKIAGLETCPFCEFAYIPPAEDKLFRCLNPECKKESCRKCKEPNHIPLSCEEVEKDDEVKKRTYIEDKMTEALVRTCWKCQKKFVKIDGCNKMTCTCGAVMCYVCRQPVWSYLHFEIFSDCPLFSDNSKLHNEEVKKQAMKAKQEVEAKYPNTILKHDPTQLFQNRRGKKRAAKPPPERQNKRRRNA